MVKTFDHAVIINGELIPANTPIEVKEAEAPKKPKKGGVKNDDTTD
jgi:hypothetical protein